jgi:hypothetical protein
MGPSIIGFLKVAVYGRLSVRNQESAICGLRNFKTDFEWTTEEVVNGHDGWLGRSKSVDRLLVPLGWTAMMNMRENSLGVAAGAGAGVGAGEEAGSGAGLLSNLASSSSSASVSILGSILSDVGGCDIANVSTITDESSGSCKNQI